MTQRMPGNDVGTSDATKVILLVEDSFDIQEVFSLILSQAGYFVVVAENGKVALKRLQTLRPKAVITDLAMPHMSGIDLAKELKKMPTLAELPIALVTAAPASLTFDHRTLFDRVLRKPCGAESLLELAKFLTERCRNSPPRLAQD